MNNCLKVHLIILRLFISVTNYGALVSRDLRLVSKPVSNACLSSVNLRQIT